jgi:potassium/chloride transporter 4/5/6
LPGGNGDYQLLSICLLTILSGVVIAGPQYVAKTGTFFLGLVLLSLLFIHIGLIMYIFGVDYGDWEGNLMRPTEGGLQTSPHFSSDQFDFKYMLALFFPSVTGIMAGANRSDVLADPGVAIPYGTIWSIITVTIMYTSLIILFGFAIDYSILIDDQLVAATVAWPHPITVQLGVIFSSIGACLQSLMGSPRLLQAIAKDEVIPRLDYFGVGAGPGGSGEPHRGLFLTWVIACMACAPGDLNAIAPAITMFFLLCYFGINLSCFVLSLLKLPSFRPKFKYFHWSTALFGFLLCLIMMFIVSWIYTVVALFLCTILMVIIAKKGSEVDWGDGTKGFKLMWARNTLSSLGAGENLDVHEKNWRPQVLALIKVEDDGAPTHLKVFDFLADLKKGRGLTLMGSVLEGSCVNEEVVSRKAAAKKILHSYELKHSFSEVVIAEDVEHGLMSLIQLSGLGALRSNSVLMTWPRKSKFNEDIDCAPRFVKMVRTIGKLKKAAIVLKGIDDFPNRASPLSGGATIDVWYIVHDGGMLLLFAFLLNQSKTWRKAKLRLFAVTKDTLASDDQTREQIGTYLSQMRIEADIHVVKVGASGIEDFAHQKTLEVRDRHEYLRQIGAEDSSLTIAMMKAGARSPKASVKSIFGLLDEDTSEKQSSSESPKKLIGGSTAATSPAQGQSPLNRRASFSDDEAGFNTSVERMAWVSSLNTLMKESSQASDLIITNLPAVLSEHVDEPVFYMNYVEEMIAGLDKVVLLRGTGKEVVTEMA